MSSTGEVACTYACLILHTDGIPVTVEKIATLVKAANVKVESYCPCLFAKRCEKKNVEELIMNVGSGGSVVSTGVVAVAAPATGEDPATAPAASEKKEEAKEESDDGAMFSLFD
ncbi:60S acidic ribosomal protein P1-like [Solanum stenotomum]|uniref:60S acidic ribosomal protein P1-like n=1 Tax=Solanum stenotomum TaxID=172797 RepID=UPI0020D016DF|nr:60S acidic ribosomal protein P1-like [Solanum stenotomum]